MTKKRDFKAIVRARMAKTGQSYATALRHIRGSGGAPLPATDHSAIVVAPSRDDLSRQSYAAAINKLVHINGPERSYRCHQHGFGYRWEEIVTTMTLCNHEAMRHPGDDLFDVVEAGGYAWLLRNGLVAFRPTPRYSTWAKAGAEVSPWRFDANDLVDQLDRICAECGVRPVIGRIDYAPWGAHFVDNTGSVREVHSTSGIGQFAGQTLEEATWAAIHDIQIPALRASMAAHDDDLNRMITRYVFDGETSGVGHVGRGGRLPEIERLVPYASDPDAARRVVERLLDPQAWHDHEISDLASRRSRFLELVGHEDPYELAKRSSRRLCLIALEVCAPPVADRFERG